jgi:hypothetical protein
MCALYQLHQTYVKQLKGIFSSWQLPKPSLASKEFVIDAK